MELIQDQNRQLLRTGLRIGFPISCMYMGNRTKSTFLKEKKKQRINWSVIQQLIVSFSLGYSKLGVILRIKPKTGFPIPLMYGIGTITILIYFFRQQNFQYGCDVVLHISRLLSSQFLKTNLQQVSSKPDLVLLT